MTLAEFVLLVLAGVCFLLAAAGVSAARVNLLGLGALLVTVVLILQGLPLTG